MTGDGRDGWTLQYRPPLPPAPPATSPPPRHGPPAPPDLPGSRFDLPASTARRVLVVAAVAAVLFDTALRASVVGVAAWAVVAVLAAGVLTVGRVRAPMAVVVVVAAPMVAAGVLVRTSPWLVGVDLVLAALLLLVGAGLPGAAEGSGRTFPDLARRCAGVVTQILLGGLFMTEASVAVLPDDAAARGRTASLARGALLAAPILLVLGLLLASADAVFASFFDVDLDAGSIVGHIVWLAAGVWLAGAVFVAGLAPAGAKGRTGRSRVALGATEALIVLAGLVVLYTTFALAQLMASLGGSDYVLATTGLTFAEYARSGFFQLLAVAALTLVVILTLRAVAELPTRRSRVAFTALSLIAVALTLVIVWSAIRRLAVYEEVFGLTMLRWGSTTFAWWIGVVFVLVAVTLALPGLRSWLVPAVVASGVLAMGWANLADPEVIVVERNIEWAESGADFDVDYAASLSSDAVPVMIDYLDELSEADRADLLGRWCSRRDLRTDPGTAGFNVSQAAARRALDPLCPP